jgi:hypothetical protein
LKVVAERANSIFVIGSFDYMNGAGFVESPPRAKNSLLQLSLSTSLHPPRETACCNCSEP